MFSSSNKTDTKYARSEQKASPQYPCRVRVPWTGRRRPETGATVRFRGVAVGVAQVARLLTLLGPAFGLPPLQFALDGFRMKSMRTSGF